MPTRRRCRTPRRRPAGCGCGWRGRRRAAVVPPGPCVLLVAARSWSRRSLLTYGVATPYARNGAATLDSSSGSRTRHPHRPGSPMTQPRSPREVFHALVHGVADRRYDDVIHLYAEQTHVEHPFDPLGAPALRTHDDLRA